MVDLLIVPGLFFHNHHDQIFIVSNVVLTMAEERMRIADSRCPHRSYLFSQIPPRSRYGTRGGASVIVSSGSPA